MGGGLRSQRAELYLEIDAVGDASPRVRATDRACSILFVLDRAFCMTNQLQLELPELRRPMHGSLTAPQQPCRRERETLVPGLGLFDHLLGRLRTIHADLSLIMINIYAVSRSVRCPARILGGLENVQAYARGHTSTGRICITT